MPLRPTARPAVESMYRFVLWLVPTVEKFPRRQKFRLVDRLQATALDVAAGGVGRSSAGVTQRVTCCELRAGRAIPALSNANGAAAARPACWRPLPARGRAGLFTR